MLSALGGAGILLSDYTVVLRSDVAYILLNPVTKRFVLPGSMKPLRVALGRNGVDMIRAYLCDFFFGGEGLNLSN